jgi:predicted nuclease of predicted toxin-antitoxin system
VTFWLDAQLPPMLAGWLEQGFPVAVRAVREPGLRNADDLTILQAARDASEVVMTKDEDFVDLLHRFGPPLQVVWVTCGNTSNARLRSILSATMPDCLALLNRGEALVEICEEQQCYPAPRLA